MFISGELVHVMSAVVGLGRDGTLAHWVTHSVVVSHSVGVTLSGCVTQDHRVGSSEGCGIHPTHPVGVVVCTSEP